MQRYCTELTERLLKSLDKEYNVVDMGAVVDVITALEKTTITKEVLEITRLGKYINELRRKTSNDALAKRAKDLVRRWRDMVLPSSHATPQPTPADTAPQALNGTKPQSPALRVLKPHSPALKNLKPHSPLMRDTIPLKQQVVNSSSPTLSLHSDQSRSPNPTVMATTKQQQHQSQASVGPTARTTNTTTNHRLNSDVTAKLGPASTQNHRQMEAVPRTHSSNKRLRKDDQAPSPAAVSPEKSPPPAPSPLTSSVIKSIRGDSNDSRFEPNAKRPRLNGETSKFSESYASNNNLVATRGLTNNSNSRSLNEQQVPSDAHDKSTIAAERLSSDVSTSIDRVDTAAAPSTGPKKRGRKKGSKSVKNQNLPEDRVKEKLASISRNPKLKTTQELLADLQARGSSLTTTPPIATSDHPRNHEPPSTQEILRNDDRSLSSRFLRSSREKSSSSSVRSSSNFITDSARTKITGVSGGKRWQSGKTIKSEDGEESQTIETADRNDEADISTNKQLTVEQILAKLPPLDLDAISWTDDDYQQQQQQSTENVVKEISQKDVDRLHGECVEGLNGNFQIQLKLSTDNDEIKSIDHCTNDHDDVKSLDAWTSAELKKKGVCRRLQEPNEDDRQFRKWHEILARPSYDGQTLHILPYVIID